MTEEQLNEIISLKRKMDLCKQPFRIVSTISTDSVELPDFVVRQIRKFVLDCGTYYEEKLRNIQIKQEEQSEEDTNNGKEKQYIR